MTMSETTLLHRESSETTACVHYDLNGDVFEPPSYTMQQIRAAIPPHCFNPSTLRSLSYVVRDFALASILVYVAATYIKLIPDVNLRFVAWAAYTICQGMVGTGIWILAHECGHGAFSRHKWLNNVMGLFMHSLLLVPFHSWRISHAKHHKATGNLQRDMVFIPRSRERWISQHKVHDPHAFQQLFGFPLYLLINVAGQKYPGSWWVKRSHFYFGGDSYIFDRKDWVDVLISDLGIAAALAALWIGTKYFGAWHAVVFYILPYLWVHHWIGKLKCSSSQRSLQKHETVANLGC
jgi:omega-6 fatty acid desaturase (delta-12 desaturase)